MTKIREWSPSKISNFNFINSNLERKKSVWAPLIEFMRRCNNIRLHKDNSSSSGKFFILNVKNLDSSSSSSLEDKPKFKLFEEHAFKNVAFQ